MPEVIVKNPSNTESLEVATTRAPFAAHTVLQPGEEKVFSVEDTNQLKIAVQGAMEQPATAGYAVPQAVLDEDNDMSKKSKGKKDVAEPKAE